MPSLLSRGFNWALFVVALLDFLCLEIALIFGYWLWMLYPWHGHWQLFSDYARLLWFVPPIGVIVFKALGLYKSQMGILGVAEQSLIFKATWLIYLMVFAVSFFYRDVYFSRVATLYSMFIFLILVSFERYFVRYFLMRLSQKGIAVARALIYGAGFQGKRLERWIRESPQLGIHVVGFLDDDIKKIAKKPEFAPFLGGLENLKEIVSRKKVSQLFIAYRKLEEVKVIEIFQLCRELGIRCWVIPSLYEFHVERVEMHNIGGVPLVGIREQFGRRSYEVIKNILDRVIGFALLVITAPLFLLIAFGIYLGLGRPIFFRQLRVGKDGKKFLIYKFRTLKTRGSKDSISPELEKAQVQETTPLAIFLRRSGFDEMPQLINVLRGEMSLIGPRPEMPFLVDRYGPIERERLTVKPGITGLWQISEDRKRILIHENMDYDLYYVDHLSFNLDLAILVKTFMTVLQRIFGRPATKASE